MRRAIGFPGTALLCGALLLAACHDTPGEPAAPARPLAAVALADAGLGNPIPGLTSAQLASFNRGKLLFENEFTPGTGLGPAFNASSCAECHGEPEEGGVTGAGGDEIETHFTNLRWDGSCDLLTSKGGFVRQDSVTPKLLAAFGLSSEPLPTTTHQRGSRTTVDVFGFGLLAAVPNQTLINLSDPFDFNYDGISGRAHYLPNGDLGKFGRKAQEGSLTLFNAGALLQEMGITNKFNPKENQFGSYALPVGVDFTPDPEISSSDFDDLNNFVLFLAPPPQLPLTTEAQAGKTLFSQTGCASCHVPTLTTTDVGIAALSYKQVSAFTDLLLHNMGSSRADICLGDAGRAEFRTEPLMGLRFVETFMHDGAAETITDAILLHGGEGARARDRFLYNLTSTQRAALLAYLQSL